MLHPFRVFSLALVHLAIPLLAPPVVAQVAQAEVATDPPAAAEDAAISEGRLLRHSRQLTFEGRRAGEGYFSRDGRQMVFQSEREPGNPFFQIYLLDFATGDIERVSPGVGKTTCAWIHPDGSQVLFASTHADPDAPHKQQAELEDRAAGRQRRYTWDYDEHYEIYVRDADGSYQNLTNARGYDAEGSWSPDGKQIVFASNRHAYTGELSEAQRKRVEVDPSFFVELYIMDADGSNLRRLTDVPGYDGGPFFSPDGMRICWRRFSESGETAEVLTMNIDGTDVRSLTRLGAMSWAPFYHPSGRYLIFTTNVHGFDNFELYLVNAQGSREPVRVTYTGGFDGLPVFTPDGQRLAWTTNRGPGGESQIYIADWNHDQALALLALDPQEQPADARLAASAAHEAVQSTQPDCSPRDVLRHVDYLCRPELSGRRTGTQGERMATAYVAAYLDQLGLEPAGDDETWFQNFEFTSGVSLGSENRLASGGEEFEVGKSWVPVSFSNTGEFAAAPVVFAGYGMAAEGSEGQEEYDSFVHLDVKDKWILAFRFLPEQLSPERRQHLSRYSSLRFKAMLARDRGAYGLILVSGPNSSVREQLIPLRFDGSLSTSNLPIVSITDEVAERWLQASGKSLKQLQDQLDTGEPVMGFELSGVGVATRIDIEQVSRQGRNTLGWLRAGPTPSSQVVIVGAHIDHLGDGMHGASLARDEARDGVHWGADDNASGVGAMLEIAQWLDALKDEGKLDAKRDILFAAWSGEEDGLIGSSHFVKTFDRGAVAHAGAAPSEHRSLYPKVAACLNMDMVGRLDKKLILQGVGSSSIWPGEIERRNAGVGLPIALQADSYIPTDASVFFTHGVPILSAFTGSHEDYHTPRDTPDKINYDGAARIAQFMALVTRSLAQRENAPDYVAATRPEPGQTRAALRAYLGTIPDYVESDVKGVKLSSVAKGGPADQAGARGGDLIVKLAGRTIENIYDYTYAIEALKIGEPVELVVKRDGQDVTLTVTPGSRQ